MTDVEIDAGIREHITAWLSGVSAEEEVRILYAAESGSRAWGFASPDSDYDVRFIYAHPRDWYISLNERRDVIERPLDPRHVDLVGWDLRKALRLALKSNPALYEWLVSPIVYANSPFAADARALFEMHADARKIALHYESIARTQWRNVGDDPAVKLKRYFYVLRPLLSIDYLRVHGTLPPMNLQALAEAVDIPAPLRLDLAALIDAKRSTPELGLGPRRPSLDRWIAGALEQSADKIRHLDGNRPDPAVAEREADVLYRRIISA